MQSLTAAPRDGLTAAQVTALLTCPDPVFAAGMELLDTSNRVTADISDDLAEAPVISCDNRNAVNRRVRFSIQRTLVWGRDRVRPYMEVSSASVPGVVARFNAGVFIANEPDEDRGEDPVTYEVSGYDLLQQLQASGPADTWVATAGTTYFDALRAIVDASGIGAPLLLDSTLQATTIPATRVWALISPNPSWLRMMYDLLAEISYTAPVADENGAITSRPYVDVSTRPIEWTLDTSDASTSIVGPKRSLVTVTGGIPNWWRFVRSNMDTTPVEGDGVYTPAPNLTDGPNSIETIGREVKSTVFMDAADQATLEAQGDRAVAEDKARVRTITLSIDPLPHMGADDVFWYVDGGEAVKVAAASWDLHLDGTQGTLVLGGAPAPPLDAINTQVKATVTSAAPLRVVVDGATVDSFANALDAGTYGIGDRVTVTVRNPLPPLVQGVES